VGTFNPLLHYQILYAMERSGIEARLGGDPPPQKKRATSRSSVFKIFRGDSCPREIERKRKRGIGDCDGRAG